MHDSTWNGTLHFSRNELLVLEEALKYYYQTSDPSLEVSELITRVMKEEQKFPKYDMPPHVKGEMRTFLGRFSDGEHGDYDLYSVVPIVDQKLDYYNTRICAYWEYGKSQAAPITYSPEGLPPWLRAARSRALEFHNLEDDDLELWREERKERGESF